jgi:endonuclease/exonuclease/phosphatase family metal-dependent hydrolase
MKVITLNTWGGRAGKENLLAFIRKHADADVFCFQEIWSAPYKHLEGSAAGGKAIDHEQIMVYGLQEISAALPNHDAYFRPHHLENYGLLVVVKKSVQVLEEGEHFVHMYKGYEAEGDVGNHARNIQYVSIKTESGPVTIINFHGLWNGKGKTDNDERLVQSERIIEFLQTRKEPIILCGDFNLLPDTESLKMLEKAGRRNLVKEYDVTSTRTSFYEKPEKYADYILVSNDIQVQEFRVLPEEVSDHAPLLLDFA